MTDPICIRGSVRTPIGRYGGALAPVRPDDMAAHVIDAAVADQDGVVPDEVVMGCANQAGEDNRNVARPPGRSGERWRGAARHGTRPDCGHGSTGRAHGARNRRLRARIELNEAFAARVLACLRHWGLPDDAGHVNPEGGAIALGHPLGMSGVRLVLAGAVGRGEARRALAPLCVGVGQGVALSLEAL